MDSNLSPEPEPVDLTGLIERRADGWYWKNGEPEPRLFDIGAAFFAPGFAQVDHEGRQYVAVPAHWEDGGAWDGSASVRDLIRQAIEEGGQLAELTPTDPPGEPIEGWIVPIELWESILCEPIGAAWRDEDDDAILGMYIKLKEG